MHRKCHSIFQFKIEIKKDIFAHFIFDFKIENWRMIKIFQFSVINYYWNIENSKYIFQFSIFEFNCRITQVEKPWLAFFNPISWSDVEFLFTKEKEKTLFYCNLLKRDRSRNSNEKKGYTLYTLLCLLLKRTSSTASATKLSSVFGSIIPTLYFIPLEFKIRKSTESNETNKV